MCACAEVASDHEWSIVAQISDEPCHLLARLVQIEAWSLYMHRDHGDNSGGRVQLDRRGSVVSLVFCCVYGMLDGGNGQAAILAYQDGGRGLVSPRLRIVSPVLSLEFLVNLGRVCPECLAAFLERDDIWSFLSKITAFARSTL